MKIKAYREKKKKKTKSITLKLVEELGGVTVTAVDEFGRDIDAGCLLAINSDGEVEFCQNINPELGFPVNKRGELTVNQLDGEESE